MRAISQSVRHIAVAGLLLVCPVPLQAASSPVADFVTADGGRYFGPLVDGKFSGRGRIEWSNGARYEGDFVGGLYSGRGRRQSASGDVYDGEFREGMKEGHGRERTADGATYAGSFHKNLYHGRGRYQTINGEVFVGQFKSGSPTGRGQMTAAGSRYQGEFKQWLYWGYGELADEDGGNYAGKFVAGNFHGKGRYKNRRGDVYEGDFVKREFTGNGVATYSDGTRYEGSFLKWERHGKGRLTETGGDVYEGQFVEGDLEGAGLVTSQSGGRYEGEFKRSRFHGQGVLRLPNGDVYKGAFADGLYEGEGTLTYAKPRPDGVTQETGTWRYGRLVNEEQAQQELLAVEAALYSQRRLLDEALALLRPRDANKINLFLLAVGGDGSQEVFRREVEFVRDQFAREFGVNGHTVALINSRNTVGTAPMATMTSIRASLQAIATRMDREKDILFLFLTSHGSRDHKFSLNQNNMNLADLPARELGLMLKETGIRWKVVVVSACYGGGFIDPLKDDYTLIITAARHDRQSFGCADENDFTYFGRAFFKESLPQSSSFQDAFRRAEVLVTEWEVKELMGADKKPGEGFSYPQMVNPELIDQHLQRWWMQKAGKK